MRMAVPVAHRISKVLNRNLPRVLNLASLQKKELVLPRCREQHEGILVSKVLHVCEAKCFSPCASTFTRHNPVSLDQFSIELFRVLSLGDSTRNVKHVAPGHISNSKLLDEPLNTRRLT